MSSSRVIWGQDSNAAGLNAPPDATDLSATIGAVVTGSSAAAGATEGAAALGMLLLPALQSLQPQGGAAAGGTVQVRPSTVCHQLLRVL